MGLYTAKETTSLYTAKKNYSKYFSGAILLFKKMCMKAVDTSVKCCLSKERVPEKNALSRFSICGQMRC